MGMIEIHVKGSFKPTYKTFSAMKSGHADCVAQAIQWLAEEVLPEAIRNDHGCHSEGMKPSDGFAVRVKP